MFRLALLVFGFVLVDALKSVPEMVSKVCEDVALGDGVRCTEDDSAVVFCQDGKVQNYQLCEVVDDDGKRCHKHTTVPHTCSTLSKTFAFKMAQQERSGHWSCSKCEDDEVADDALHLAFADFENTEYYYETKSELEMSEHSDDLLLSEFSPALKIPSGASIHGIKVRAKMRSRLTSPSLGKTIEDDGNVFCYLSSVELRTGSHVSGNRGSDEVTPKQKIPSEWTAMTYGGRLDVWDEYETWNEFGPDTKLEIDAKAGIFDNHDEYHHSGEPWNSVFCDIAGAELIIYYSVPPTGLFPKHLVRAGNLTDSTRWQYFDPRDSHNHAIVGSPDDDSAKRKWYDPKYSVDKDYWKLGYGVFGYGDETHPETTHISSHQETAYFRTTFELEEGFDVSCLGDIHISLLVDDGAIIYLNGQVLWWINLDPEHYGLPKYEERALRKVFHESIRKNAVVPDNALLKPGVNHVAVEVHQVHPKSSDLQFDLSIYAINHCKDEVDKPNGSGDAPGTGKANTPAANTPAATVASGGDKSQTTESTDALGGDASKQQQQTASPGSPVAAGGEGGNLGTLLFAAAAIALLLFALFFAWKKYGSGRQSRGGSFASGGGGGGGGTSHGYVNFIEERDDMSPLVQEQGEVPRTYPTEPELTRAPYSGGAGANGLGKVQKKQLDTTEWSDF